MTEQQIEKAAREYCRLLGLDPDEMVGHGADPTSNGLVMSVILYSQDGQGFPE